MKDKYKHLKKEIDAIKSHLEEQKFIIRFDDPDYAIFKPGKWNEKLWMINVMYRNQIPVNEVAKKNIQRYLGQLYTRTDYIQINIDKRMRKANLPVNDEDIQKEIKELTIIFDKAYKESLNELENLEIRNDGEVSIFDSEYLIYKVVPWTKKRTSTWKKDPIYKPFNKAAKEFRKQNKPY